MFPWDRHLYNGNQKKASHDEKKVQRALMIYVVPLRDPHENKMKGG